MSAYQAERVHFKHLVVVLVLLIIADGLISQFLVGHGLGREGNPFLRGLIGGGGFLLVKTAGALLASILLWDIYRRRPRVAVVCTASFVLLYTGIVYWNIGVLLFVRAYL